MLAGSLVSDLLSGGRRTCTSRLDVHGYLQTSHELNVCVCGGVLFIFIFVNKWFQYFFTAFSECAFC